MKTQEFKGDIVNLAYGSKSFQNKNKETIENYFVRLKLAEVKKGMSKHNVYHKGILYLTKEQYQAQEFELNDRVTVSDKVQWESRAFSYESHNQNVVKKKLEDEYEKRNVYLDSENKPYWKVKDYAYSFKAKINEITISEKHDKLAYWIVDGIKFYMPTIDALQLFVENNLYSTYIMPADFNDYEKVISKLKELNGQNAECKLYMHKNIKRREQIRVLFAFDTENKLYYVNLLKEDDNEKDMEST